MKTLPRVAAEMALHVLGYNLTRVMNIMGIHRYGSPMGVTGRFGGGVAGAMSGMALSVWPACRYCGRSSGRICCKTLVETALEP
jgi:hypothetical protein